MDVAITELLAEMGHEVDLTNHLEESEAAKVESDETKADAKPEKDAAEAE